MDNMFNEPHSLAIRIWHWTFFVVVTASLVTVLFASTIFRTRNTIGLVQDPLQQKGVIVNEDQARTVSHELIMALTGLGLAFEDNAWLKEGRASIKQIHSFVQYLIYGFILLHLVGVIRADANSHKGLVSGMIHGKKQQ